MGTKILIVSQSHLCRNPRVLKEAIALSGAGYLVTILTAIYSGELLKEDMELLKQTPVNYAFYSDLRTSGLRSVISRLTRKVASELNFLFRINSKYSLGHDVNQLLKQCIEHDAGLYIMHQELPTVIGCILIKKKYRVAFDLEDWYSEDLLEIARKKRPIKLLRRSEQFALKNAACCYTTSTAMANAMAESYGYKPHVIYNTFLSDKNTSTKPAGNGFIRLYWLSQTTGPGRGIEFFIDGMAGSTYNWCLTLRGNADSSYKAFLEGKISPKDRLIFEPLLKNKEILTDIANYDFGLALEPDVPLNRNLSISNKLFYYLAGGLPVIASNILGHQEIGSKHPEIIFLYKNGDISYLVDLLNNLGKEFEDPSFPGKALVSQVFDKYYSWDDESKKLVSLVTETFNLSID